MITRSWPALTPAQILDLVRCPPSREQPWHPKEQASPSALQLHAHCPRAWAHCYLEGRRDPSLTWAEAEQIPEPPKPPKGASALAKAEAEAARKAWNKVRRPALGTEVHDILEAYVTQGVPGMWHPPMAWREIDWHSTAGRIAQPATDVLPDPRGLVAAYTELEVDVEAPEAWYAQRRIDGSPGVRTHGGPPWPKMPGYYDLITVEQRRSRPEGVFKLGPPVYRLWDYKSTSSFDWAKTEDELREDPQVLLYALHAMQKFGLQEIECNWVYLLTDPEKKPKSFVVTVTITRAEAEYAVLEMAETAAELVDNVRLFRGGKLRVADLEQNVSACTAYGGCIYHIDKGGPCEARVRPGVAMKQKAELEAKIKARKSARKETERDMALSFAQRKAEKEQKDAAAAAAEAPAPAEQPAAEPAAEAPAQADAAPKAELAKPKPATKPKAPMADGSVSAAVDGYDFAVPAKSSLGQAILKAAKAHQALTAAFEGE